MENAYHYIRAAELKIHILYDLKDHPWGGGNQFLRALKNYLNLHGVYSNDLTKADVILFNSIGCIASLPGIREANPNAAFIHRMDGVYRLHRKASGVVQDKMSYLANRWIADATVFQSSWAMQTHIRFGFDVRSNYTVILNAADTDIFRPKVASAECSVLNVSPSLSNRRRAEFYESVCVKPVKIMTSSWSTNWKKGFEILQYLDQNLDFDRVQISFAGNSPVQFQRIKMLGPLTSTALAQVLQSSDIYLSAVEDDACSNALLEALACGLTCLARRSGGNPEILATSQHKNVLFDGEHDILEALEQAIAAFRYGNAFVQTTRFEDAAHQYLALSRSLHGSPRRKGLNRVGRLWFAFMLRFYDRIVRLKRYQQRLRDRLSTTLRWQTIASFSRSFLTQVSRFFGEWVIRSDDQKRPTLCNFTSTAQRPYDCPKHHDR